MYQDQFYHDDPHLEEILGRVRADQSFGLNPERVEYHSPGSVHSL